MQAVSLTKKKCQARSLGRLTVVWLVFLVAALIPAYAQQPPDEQLINQQTAGRIDGTIVDSTEAVVVGAHVRLARVDQSPGQEILSDDQGQFSFANVAPGPFQLTISFTDLHSEVVSGTVHPGEIYVVPQVTLAVATQVTQVTVGLTREELAEVQIKDQEKQRVLGIVPNFYASYVPDAEPLTPKQKFELAWRSSRELIRPETASVDTGRGHKGMPSATAQRTLTWFWARSSEVP
jgi:carboxypeptidase family protein